MLVEPIKYRITDVGYDVDLFLEERCDDSWAITDGIMCMNKNFDFEYEPSPSNRTEKFLKEFRFTFNESIEQIEKISKKNKGQ